MATTSAATIMAEKHTRDVEPGAESGGVVRPGPFPGDVVVEYADLEMPVEAKRRPAKRPRRSEAFVAKLVTTGEAQDEAMVQRAGSGVMADMVRPEPVDVAEFEAPPTAPGRRRRESEGETLGVVSQASSWMRIVEAVTKRKGDRVARRKTQPTTLDGVRVAVMFMREWTTVASAWLLWYARFSAITCNVMPNLTEEMRREMCALVHESDAEAKAHIDAEEPLHESFDDFLGEARTPDGGWFRRVQPPRDIAVAPLIAHWHRLYTNKLEEMRKNADCDYRAVYGATVKKLRDERDDFAPLIASLKTSLGIDLDALKDDLHSNDQHEQVLWRMRLAERRDATASLNVFDLNRG
jgi:hypothetical protein